jgi:hypothetical protein
MFLREIFAGNGMEVDYGPHLGLRGVAEAAK